MEMDYWSGLDEFSRTDHWPNQEVRYMIQVYVRVQNTYMFGLVKTNYIIWPPLEYEYKKVDKKSHRINRGIKNVQKVHVILKFQKLRKIEVYSSLLDTASRLQWRTGSDLRLALWNAYPWHTLYNPISKLHTQFNHNLHTIADFSYRHDYLLN